MDELAALYKQKRYAELAGLATTLTERLPGHVAGWKALGAALKQMGRDAEAVESLQKALALAPADVDVHYSLAMTLREAGRLHEAEVILRQALGIRPDDPGLHNALGIVLSRQESLPAAEASFREAIRLRPDDASAHYNLSDTLHKLGRLDEADSHCRQAIRLRPGSLDLRISLTRIKRTEAGDENLIALMKLEEAARNGEVTVSAPDAIRLHFALGKCHDDLDHHAEAFRHFLEANRLKRASLDYDPAVNRQYFASVMQVFDRALMDRLRGGGHPSDVPIFVLGMPRSGTTLVEQIISSHPAVHGAGELPFLLDIARREVAGASFPENIPSLDPAMLAAWASDYLSSVQQLAPAARRITNKMPGNFLAIGLIHLMLPSARIIHVRRDPLDTCLSCFTKPFERGHAFTYDLAELGRYYVDYARLMEHWRKLLPPAALLEVEYEAVVADQEGQSRRILEHCGLDWSDACLGFHLNARPVHTASKSQVRRPIYRSAVGRGRAYEKFLGPLRDELEALSPRSS